MSAPLSAEPLPAKPLRAEPLLAEPLLAEPLLAEPLLAEKGRLVQQLIKDLETALEMVSGAARSAHAAATHPESKPENDKDTRGVELAYLAAGQATRAAEMARTLSALRAFDVRAYAADEPIGPSALVDLTDDADGSTQCVFVAPVGGGLKTALRGQPVAVVTHQSPLGDAILKKRRGEEVEVMLGRNLRALTITRVR